MATKSSNKTHVVLDVNIWLDFLVMKKENSSGNYLFRDLNSTNFALKIIKPFLAESRSTGLYDINTSSHILNALSIVLKDYYLWNESETQFALDSVKSLCSNSGGSSDLDFSQSMPFVEKVIKTKNKNSVDLIDYEDMCVLATAADIARDQDQSFLITNDAGLLSFSSLTLPKLGVGIVSSRNFCQFIVSQ